MRGFDPSSCGGCLQLKSRILTAITNFIRCLEPPQEKVIGHCGVQINVYLPFSEVGLVRAAVVAADNVGAASAPPTWFPRLGRHCT